MKRGELCAIIESYILTHTITAEEAEALRKKAEPHLEFVRQYRTAEDVHELLDGLADLDGLDEPMITVHDGSRHCSLFVSFQECEWTEKLELELDKALACSRGEIVSILRRHGIEDSSYSLAPAANIEDDPEAFTRILEGTGLPEDDQPAS